MEQSESAPPNSPTSAASRQERMSQLRGNLTQKYGTGPDAPPAIKPPQQRVEAVIARELKTADQPGGFEDEAEQKFNEQRKLEQTAQQQISRAKQLEWEDKNRNVLKLIADAITGAGRERKNEIWGLQDSAEKNNKTAALMAKQAQQLQTEAQQHKARAQHAKTVVEGNLKNVRKVGSETIVAPIAASSELTAALYGQDETAKPGEEKKIKTLFYCLNT